MTKNELRTIYKTYRQGLSDQEILQTSKQISDNLLSLEIWDKNVFHIFLPIESQREIITFFIVQHLWLLNKTVILPKVVDSELLNFIYTPETNLTKNQWNILEPNNAELINESKIDIVFIPMLICDKQGHRVGYGKGFYDKFLAKCKTDVIKVGLNYFPPINQIQDINEYDQTLDYCVSPEEIVSFSASTDSHS